MTSRQFNYVVAGITILSLLAAFALTSISVEISKNKATNQAKQTVLGTWTDTTNPQRILQFTNENEYKENGVTMAEFKVNPNDSTITLDYPDGNQQIYGYALSPNHSELTLTNTQDGTSIVYSR